MKVEGFDWDSGNLKKCQKHGVRIEEIEYIFQATVFVFPDVKHSEDEVRYLAVGITKKKRYVFIAFTYRNKRIRPISARYMHKKEVKNYKEYI